MEAAGIRFMWFFKGLLSGRPVSGRLIEGLVLLAAAAGVGFACFVYTLGLQGDDAREASQRQALRQAVETARDVIGEFPSLEHQGLRMLERESGIRGLRLAPADEKPAGPLQPVVDRKGRIIAWLGFDPDRPISAFLIRLAPAAIVFFLVLGGIAAALIWQLRLLNNSLGESQDRVRRMHQLDQVTGLPNHRRMLELAEAVLVARKPGQATVVANFDLDRFKDINEAIGHDGGDQVLAMFAERLHDRLPQGTVCGRFAADEFVAVLNISDAEAADDILAAIHADLNRPVWVHNRAVPLSVSIGLSLAPAHGESPDELMRCANAALRVAKSRGAGALATFDPSMDAGARDRRAIERDLKRAISEGALDLHYQPIVAADGTRIVGVEGLLRWDHPNRGMIAPLDFVPVAEQAGLMEPLGEYVLRRALSDARRWPDLYVSVNVSPLQVRDRKFVELIARLLQEHKISPSRLVLEITESVLIDNPEEAKARLDALRGLGTKIALDDFGTGFSSLSYLQRFSFDKLKIDKAFVAPLGRGSNAGAMIQAIVALGNALGLSILAEGVESDEQRVLLRLAGCHEMQGYLFAMPCRAADLDAVLREAKARAGGRTSAA